jgi:hypothetical protein
VTVVTHDNEPPTVKLGARDIHVYLRFVDPEFTGRWQLIVSEYRALLYLEVEYTTIRYTHNFDVLTEDREVKFICENDIDVCVEHHYPIQSCS